MKETVTINEKTRIGLFAVLGAIPVFVIVIFYGTMVYFKAEASEKKNLEQDVAILSNRKEVDLKIDSQMLVLIEIRDRLTRLEEQVKRGR